MTKFGLLKGVDKATLWEMYAAMTGDASAARTSAEVQMDGRMRLYLESDKDPELEVDMRGLSQKPTLFTEFWERGGEGAPF
jgi:hypothetical protein